MPLGSIWCICPPWRGTCALWFLKREYSPAMCTAFPVQLVLIFTTHTRSQNRARVQNIFNYCHSPQALTSSNRASFQARERNSPTQIPMLNNNETYLLLTCLVRTHIHDIPTPTPTHLKPTPTGSSWCHCSAKDSGNAYLFFEKNSREWPGYEIQFNHSWNTSDPNEYFEVAAAIDGNYWTKDAVFFLDLDIQNLKERLLDHCSECVARTKLHLHHNILTGDDPTSHRLDGVHCIF